VNERESTDAFAIQSESAEQVARALQARQRAGSNANARFLTKNPAAYDLMMKADQKFFGGFFDQAIPLYVAAHELDHSYILPVYMLAHAHFNLVHFGQDPARRVTWAAEGRRWADLTMQLDPSGLGAVVDSHYCSIVLADYVRALEQAEKGLRSLPNDTATPTFYGMALQGLGRMSEALTFYRDSKRLDPLLLFSLLNEMNSLTCLRRNAEAEALIAQIVEIVGSEKRFIGSEWSLAAQRFRLRGVVPSPDELPEKSRDSVLWLWRARRFAEADQLAREVQRASQSDLEAFELRLLQHDALHRLNRAAEAADYARELREIAGRLQTVPDIGRPRPALWVARAEARLGHAEAAIAAGHRFVEEASPTNQTMERWKREIVLAEIFAYVRQPRDSVEILARLLRVPCGLTVPMLKADPVWDNLREDPGFKALLADPKNSAPL
jgi:tetratricopeptide (TPR) repeat protein